jgi:hypothetical protein
MWHSKTHAGHHCISRPVIFSKATLGDMSLFGFDHALRGMAFQWQPESPV